MIALDAEKIDELINTVLDRYPDRLIRAQQIAEMVVRAAEKAGATFASSAVRAAVVAELEQLIENRLPLLAEFVPVH